MQVLVTQCLSEVDCFILASMIVFSKGMWLTVTALHLSYQATCRTTNWRFAFKFTRFCSITFVSQAVPSEWGLDMDTVSQFSQGPLTTPGQGRKSIGDKQPR